MALPHGAGTMERTINFIAVTTLPGKTPEADPGAHAPSSGRHTPQQYLYDLSSALERLWVYYQAMHRGMPVTTGDELWIKRS